MGITKFITKWISRLGAFAFMAYFAIQLVVVQNEIQMSKQYYATLVNLEVAKDVLILQNISITLQDLVFVFVFAMFLTTSFVFASVWRNSR